MHSSLSARHTAVQWALSLPLVGVKRLHLYAGVLYDPASKRVAGLQPRHFITLATPHLGCGGEGPAQVLPYICSCLHGTCWGF